MKISLDETIEVEFDEWTLKSAVEWIEQIKAKHPDRFDDVLGGLLTALLFRQVERNAPGTLDRLLSATGKARDAARGEKGAL